MAHDSCLWREIGISFIVLAFVNAPLGAFVISGIRNLAKTDCHLKTVYFCTLN